MTRQNNELRHRDIIGVPTRPQLGLCVVKEAMPSVLQLCGRMMYLIQSIEHGTQVILSGEECVMMRPSEL